MSSQQNNSFKLRVWGDYACFTRPEMKAERMSYEVMTPSAARNIFQAILWKPAIEWQIHQIDVLKPIRWISLRRNELGCKTAVGAALQAAKSNTEFSLFIEDERQQRAGLFLREVDYVIHASFEMTGRAGPKDNEPKFREQFQRRAMKGQCFIQPYLGCREFSAFFALLGDGDQVPEPIAETRELGLMLHDIDYKSGNSAKFFSAKLDKGVLKIPTGAIGL